MGTLDSSVLKASVLCFTGGLASGIIMSKIIKAFNKSEDFDEKNPPEKWARVGNISNLVIYPVKSLPGIVVDRAVCTALGLQDATNPNLRDRTFVITDAKGGSQTQRLIPTMALIFPSVIGDTLELRFKGNETQEETSISVKFPRNDGSNKKLIRIWTDKVHALDCGDEVGTWLDKVTGLQGLRLCYHDSTSSQRKVAAAQKIFPMFSATDTGAFHDETSYMMMTEESLAELNSKLPRTLTMRTFRPSLIMNGASEPWVEDFWTFIRIGSDPEKSPRFKTSRPCARCKMTTIDPDTGNTFEDGEPIKTLISMKRQVRDAEVTKIVKNSAIMGTHFGMFGNENATIHVGDAVYTAIL